MHWEVPVDRLGFMGTTFSLSNRFAITDTGTTLIVMPLENWENLYEMVCSKLEPLVVKCKYEGGHMFLEAPGIVHM